MNPSALRDRKFLVGDLHASQSVNVHADEFYVITCFEIPLGNGTTYHSKGSDLPFADAARLDDDEWRKTLAESHLRKMAQELRVMLAVVDAQLEKLAPVRAPASAEETLLAEGLEQIERAAAPLPQWMETKR